MPQIEVVLQKVTLSVEKRGLDQESIRNLLLLYQRLFSYYNTSLDLIRKILVYFPPPRDAADSEILSILTIMDAASKERFLEVLRQFKVTESTDVGSSNPPPGSPPGKAGSSGG